LDGKREVAAELLTISEWSPTDLDPGCFRCDATPSGHQVYESIDKF